MLKIMCVCGAGMGSSFACQMSVEDVLKKLGVAAKVDHCDISSVKGTPVDLFIAGQNFQKQFDKFHLETPQVFLHRLTNKAEIEEKLTPVLKELGAI